MYGINSALRKWNRKTLWHTRWLVVSESNKEDVSKNNKGCGHEYPVKDRKPMILVA